MLIIKSFDLIVLLFFFLLENKGLTLPISSHQQHESMKLIKKQIIELAKEWPIYFSRLFPVAVSVF